MSMFDIEVPASSVTKSIEKQPSKQIESILPKRLNNDVINFEKDRSPKDSTLPSTVDGNANGAIKSTLSVKSHVM